MGFLLSLIFGLFPMFLYATMLYWADRFEKEPRKLLFGVFLWGMFIAAGGAILINTVSGIGIYYLLGSKTATQLTIGTLIAPIVEETLKGFAVLIIFLAFHDEFDSVLDGIVYAGITALGFAATENIYYIYNFGFLENGFGGLFWLVFVRVILVGWQHVFYTAFIGIGFAFSRLRKEVWLKVSFPIIGWLLAIFSHSIHNTLGEFLGGFIGTVIGILVDWTGWFFMLLIIIWAIYRESKWMTEYLKGEIDLGTITAKQYKTAISSVKQTMARTSALFKGKYKKTSQFYNLCAELAQKKHQLATLGDEDDNKQKIERLRNKITDLTDYEYT